MRSFNPHEHDRHDARFGSEGPNVKAALHAALTVAMDRGLFLYLPIVDEWLYLAEPFVEPDYLRTRIGDVTGCAFIFAVVPTTDLIEERSYLWTEKTEDCPEILVFLAALGPGRYAPFAEGGEAGFVRGVAGERERLAHRDERAWEAATKNMPGGRE